MEEEKELTAQAEEIITEMCLDEANAQQEEENYGEQLLQLAAQVEALQAENLQLRKSIELLQSLPRFSAQTKASAEGFSAIREIFRSKK